MDLLKANPISYYKFLLIGDSFLDFYFKENELEVFKGGVLNVQKNINFLTKKEIVIKTSKKPKVLNFFKNNLKVFLKTNTKEKINSEIIFAKVVTISDYNKGYLNNKIKIHSKILIVDSKYCSLPIDYIIHSKIKILKLSSTDVFNSEFIELFDFLIVTSSTYVNLYQKNKLLYSYNFKKKYDPICTIGAGDVFLASLTCSLYDCFRQFKLSKLITAIDLASLQASKSVTTPFTSRIKEI
jgi:hypothetical protein